MGKKQDVEGLFDLAKKSHDKFIKKNIKRSNKLLNNQGLDVGRKLARERDIKMFNKINGDS